MKPSTDKPKKGKKGRATLHPTADKDKEKPTPTNVPADKAEANSTFTTTEGIDIPIDHPDNPPHARPGGRRLFDVQLGKQLYTVKLYKDALLHFFSLLAVFVIASVVHFCNTAVPAFMTHLRGTGEQDFPTAHIVGLVVPPVLVVVFLVSVHICWKKGYLCDCGSHEKAEADTDTTDNDNDTPNSHRQTFSRTSNRPPTHGRVQKVPNSGGLHVYRNTGPGGNGKMVFGMRLGGNRKGETNEEASKRRERDFERGMKAMERVKYQEAEEMRLRRLEREREGGSN